MLDCFTWYYIERLVLSATVKRKSFICKGFRSYFTPQALSVA